MSLVGVMLVGGLVGVGIGAYSSRKGWRLRTSMGLSMLAGAVTGAACALLT